MKEEMKVPKLTFKQIYQNNMEESLLEKKRKLSETRYITKES